MPQRIVLMLFLRILLPTVLVVIVLLAPLAVSANPEITGRARTFLQAHTNKLRPLEIDVARAWWDANTTGKAEDFDRKEKAQNRIDEALADPVVFANVKKLYLERSQIDDPVLRRAIDVVYLQYLEKQLDRDLLRKMVAKSNTVEKAFSTFRARIDGKEMTDNEVRRILKESKDVRQRQAVWEASKEVGKLLWPDLAELVKLRNEAARKLGFANFHALQLYLNEQDGKELIRLFDELDKLTRGPFRAAKTEIDARLAVLYGIKVEALLPWHYHDPFFQETPSVFATNLDQPFVKADLLAVSRNFYAGIGLPIDRVIARSSLYEKPGKNPHAFCTDIDRQGDVRVLANIVNNAYWMSTLLHEFGHAVYSTNNGNIPLSVPYVLRQEAHTLATEGVAMMFDRATRRRAWVEKVGLQLDQPEAFEEAAARSQRYQLLIFSRWCQVMLRFEKSMYEKPDQDLGKLWWDLVEQYQLLGRPPARVAPDFASKIHIVNAPVYYHNYMMGELFASQLHHTISRDVYKGADPNTVIYVGNKEVGSFMLRRVIAPGRTLSWNELAKHATGEPLNARAFAADFKGK
jgi:peptidyl-dipeptidase A